MNKLVHIVLFLGSALALAVMGCACCWRIPAFRGPDFVIYSQAFYNLLGIALCCGIWYLGWRRSLRFAPWLMGASLLLLLIAQFTHPILGSHRWLRIGPFLTLNVRTVLIFVTAFFFAWLLERFRSRAWLVWLVAGVVLLMLAGLFLSNPARLMRILGATPACISDQWRIGIAISPWFGSAGRSLRCVYFARTEGIVAGAALIFGKFFVVLAFAFIGTIGGCLLAFARRVTDRPRRVYLALLAVVLVVPTLFVILQNLNLTAVRGCAFTLLGYGGTDVLMTWFGIGLALAAIRDAEFAPAVKLEALGTWAVPAFVVFGLFAALILAPVPKGGFFREPLPKDAELGPYGTSHERGRILAADGEVLARSVKSYDIRIDPVFAFAHCRNSTNEIVEVVAKGLDLPQDYVRELYGRKGRYILAIECADDAVVAWSKSRHARNRGVIAEERQRREYPLRDKAAHVTGHCYTIKLSGSMGLEYVGDGALTGTNGYVRESSTYATNLITGRPIHGGTVRTTINVPMQKAVAELLEAYAETNAAESAWALAVSVPRGEIVAMASWPSFDPSEKYSVDEPEDPNPRRNFAVQAVYEPGALMSPLVYAFAVHAGKLDASALEDVSSVTNVCRNMGTNLLWQCLKRLNIGSRIPDSKLFGEERGMALRPANWLPWALQPQDVGRGVALTGVQIAQCYATLANGGVRVFPHLVTGMTDAKGAVWSYPTPPARRLVSLEAAAAVSKALQAQRADVPYVAGVAAAGTGAIMGRDGLYAGYFPAAKPDYVLVVGFRHPAKDGGEFEPSDVRAAFERMATAILSVQRNKQTK